MGFFSSIMPNRRRNWLYRSTIRGNPVVAVLGMIVMGLVLLLLEIFVTKQLY